jgi:phenylpyruvate tautomerase
MPVLHVLTSAPLPEDGAWMRALSALLARELDKPEEYVMVIAAPRPAMIFGGSPAPACYAELKNVGGFESPETLSRKLCDALAAALGVPTDRIYIEFANADGRLWGWNGTTFG